MVGMGVSSELEINIRHKNCKQTASPGNEKVRFSMIDYLIFPIDWLTMKSPKYLGYQGDPFPVCTIILMPHFFFPAQICAKQQINHLTAQSWFSEDTLLEEKV